MRTLEVRNLGRVDYTRLSAAGIGGQEDAFRAAIAPVLAAAAPTR